ncbi:MAG TPA: hypothetical protein VFO29_11535 [Candidatus Rubrimentiphilum sp.]|nr:hypothetical protein [Candidatus Rubrimentiphilum sp.]
MNLTKDDLERTADGDPLIDRGIMDSPKNSVTQPDEEPDEIEDDPDEEPEEEEDL